VSDKGPCVLLKKQTNIANQNFEHTFNLFRNFKCTKKVNFLVNFFLLAHRKASPTGTEKKCVAFLPVDFLFFQLKTKVVSFKVW
jgi:hypothetical protein